MPTSMVDLCCKPPNWFGHMNPFAIEQNWSLLLMTFSKLDGVTGDLERR